MKPVMPSRILVFLAITMSGCGFDLWTKGLMFDQLGMPRQQPVWWVLPGVFGFHTSLNTGALFGIGQDYTLVFAGLSIVAAVAVLVWLFVYRAAEDWVLTVSLACVMAGIFGNLYDRLGFHGLTWPEGYPSAGEPVYAVRDWILVMIGTWPWPTFNIADSLLVIGAALLLWHAVWLDRGANPDDPAAAKAAEG